MEHAWAWPTRRRRPSPKKPPAPARRPYMRTPLPTAPTQTSNRPSPRRRHGGTSRRRVPLALRALTSAKSSSTPSSPAPRSSSAPSGSPSSPFTATVPPFSSRRTEPEEHTMRTTLRTLAGLAAISALIGGPPAALWKFRTAYLPDRVADRFAWLTTRADGSLFLLLLVGVGLVAWFQLLVAFGVEATAALRGTRRLRLPGFGWAQRLAAGVLLLVLAGTATAEAAEVPPHVVVTGDTLSSIAEAELGDAGRYREIYELNRGVPQPGGDALRDPELLKPGWVLQLPGSDEVIVRPGQTLSEIARDRLGDSHRYQDIFDLNRDRPQPSGLVSG